MSCVKIDSHAAARSRHPGGVPPTMNEKMW
jgi:hypothetical protein